MTDYLVRCDLGIPIGLLSRITDFAKRYKIKHKSTAIRQLVETGLLVESKIGMAETWSSEDLKEIKQQFESGQLVDWLAELDYSKFNTIMNIVRSEDEIRSKQRARK